MNKNYINIPTFMLLKYLDSLPTIPTLQEMENNYGINLDMMFQDHNKLIGMILTEEEDLIESHK
jgi:hypothetical protein